jgi:hypothetical protein
VTKWHPATKLLVLAALLVLPYLLWAGSTEQAPVVVASVERAAPTEAELALVEPPPTQFVLPPLERFTAVVERPLFSPTRRMPIQPLVTEPDAPAPTPEAPVAEGPAEPELRFFGTVRQGGNAAALVTYPATAEVARLRPGDAVGEWQVISVERNRLELGLGEERRAFEIFGSGVRGTPEDAPAPSQAAVQGGEPASEPYADETLPELE